MNKNILVVLALAAVTLLSACANNHSVKDKVSETVSQQANTDNHAADASAPVETLPAFSIEDMQGNAINLQQIKGRKIFVNLWASWCPPCRREMPSIEKLMKSIDTSRVTFVMISLDDNFDKAKKYIRNQKLSLPIFYPAEQLPELFNVDGIPSTFIFDEQGKLLHHVEGGEDYNTDAYRNLLK